MADKKGGKASSGMLKWGLIIGAIVLAILGIAAALFIFLLPSNVAVGEEGAPAAPIMPEIIARTAVVLGVVVGGIVFLAAIIFIIYELFFKKRELHIIKEHHKVIVESTKLNPVETLGNIVLTGSNKIQSYPIGKITGHTQIPINFERLVILDRNGKVDNELSETEADLKERIEEAQAEGHGFYDFFAFITRKGFYALPFISLLEPPKIFACYPSERSPDLVGDVEIYDIGTWKISGVNIFVPGKRHQEPMHTVKEFEGQLFPIAYMSLIDYIGLVAQRGIEGDTSMQKWLEAKASTVNIKESDA